MKTEEIREIKNGYLVIPKTFKANGFIFTLLSRKGNIAIYKKDKPEYPCGFEVILIKRHDGYEIAGNKVEPSEVYPSSEQWGSLGFTYTELDKAEKKFKELLHNENKSLA